MHDRLLAAIYSSSWYSHLPAVLLASFVKRLSRLSLNASPSAIIMIIPFIYNILKRHPTLMIMIHNSDGADDSNNGEYFIRLHGLYSLTLFFLLEIRLSTVNPTQISHAPWTLPCGSFILTKIITIRLYPRWHACSRRPSPNQRTHWKIFWTTRTIL